MVVSRLCKLIIVSSVITSAVAIGVGGAASAASDSSFDVTITDINTPVVEGETVVIEAKITNTADEEQSEQIHLKRNGSIVDSVKNPSVTLAAGESTDLTLKWTPEYGDAGPAELAVWSNEYGAVRTIEVGEGPIFPVTADGNSGPIVAGESLTVSLSVRNTGDMTATTPVELSVENERQDWMTVELAPGETRQIDLTWETTETDAGVRAMDIVSADAATELRVRIFESKEEVSTDTPTESPESTSDSNEAVSSDPATESTESTSDSNEVVSTDAATEATVNEGNNAGITELPDAGISAAAAVLVLLAVALVAFGLRRR